MLIVGQTSIVVQKTLYLGGHFRIVAGDCPDKGCYFEPYSCNDKMIISGKLKINDDRVCVCVGLSEKKVEVVPLCTMYEEYVHSAQLIDLYGTELLH